MLKSTGVPSPEELKTIYPSEERLAQGPVAVIECFQRIPCNPCGAACRRGAIQPFDDINNQPRINVERCNGCGLCVANCPGLAIFVVDETYKPDTALVKIPYEFLPLPQKGTTVPALDRSGEQIGEAVIIAVQNPPTFDRTVVVHLQVPRSIARDVRNIRVEGASAHA